MVQRFVNKKPLYLLGAVALILVFQASLTQACKYSVRDVAFVDLGVQPYLLRYSHDDKDEALTKSIRAILKGTNIQFEYVASNQTSMMIVAPDGRKLRMEDGAALDSVNALVNSPLRQRLKNLSLQHHSVVMLINGSNAAANAIAKQSADTAATSINAVLDKLPKPIKRGPVVVVVDAKTARSERVLLWSLGLDEDQNDEATIAIIYGRLRRLGPLLTAPPATNVDLIANMNLIGQDCECELERAWMTGPMIPHRWTTEDEAAAVNALDFDPGSPLVRSEIQRILARGPSTGGPRNERIGEARPIDPLLGYSEVEIEPETNEEVDPPLNSGEVASTAALDGTATAITNDQSPGSSRGLWIAIGIAATIIFAVGIHILRREGQRQR